MSDDNQYEHVVITSKGRAMLVLTSNGVSVNRAIELCDALERAGVVGEWKVGEHT